MTPAGAWGRSWRAALLAMAGAAGFTGVAHAQASSLGPVALGPVVLGQSLPLSGPGFATANRIQAGAKALLERVNAAGGIQGRMLELVTLDDGGDPQRTAANARTLVQRHGALALLNCLGELPCLAAAQASQALGVPLVGPFSGAQALRQPPQQAVFSLRADDAREAQALLRQLQGMAVQRVALLVDDSEPARQRVLASTLQAAGLQLHTLRWSDPANSLHNVLQALQAQPVQALVLNVGLATLDQLDRAQFGQQAGVPSVVTTLSTTGLTQLMAVFRQQMVGFTSVVPNPDTSQLPLVRELQRDADAHVGPEALNFDGLSAYLHLRLVAEALQRHPKTSTPAQLTQAIESLGAWSAGGWRLNFSGNQHHGSEAVEIGLRGRDGRLRH